MGNFYERYQHGFRQEVYKDLLARGESIFDDPLLYDDALAVTRETIRRVRFNLEQVLIPRLQTVGYRFGDGSWTYPDHLSEETLRKIQQEDPVFLASPPDAPQHLEELEHLIGTLPFSIRCWYEEIATVNLIGSFPLDAFQERKPELQEYKAGYGLDPLYIFPLERVVEELKEQVALQVWDADPVFPLSLDGLLKYGYSGSGGYGIRLPCRSIDGYLTDEAYRLPFIEYLRMCLQKGGFPGLGPFCSLAEDLLDFLTKDLLPF